VYSAEYFFHFDLWLFVLVVIFVPFSWTTDICLRKLDGRRNVFWQTWHTNWGWTAALHSYFKWNRKWCRCLYSFTQKAFGQEKLFEWLLEEESGKEKEKENQCQRIKMSSPRKYSNMIISIIILMIFTIVLMSPLYTLFAKLYETAFSPKKISIIFTAFSTKRFLVRETCIRKPSAYTTADFSKKSTVGIVFVWRSEMNFCYVLRYGDSQNDI